MTGLWFWEHRPVSLNMDEFVKFWFKRLRMEEYVAGILD